MVGWSFAREVELWSSQVRRVGWLSALAYSPFFVFARVAEGLDGFDREHGTDTRTETIEALALEGDLGAATALHMPSRVADVRRAIARMRTDAVFVDVGCGKGRVVLEAARHPFTRVVGLEASAPMAAIARANVERVLGAEQRRIEIWEGDASTYAWPDAPLALYVFRPFKEPVWTRFARTLGESLRARPRPVDLVLVAPSGEERLREAGLGLRTTYWSSFGFARVWSSKGPKALPGPIRPDRRR